MRQFFLAILIPGFAAIIVGLYTMNYFDLSILNFLFSNDQLIWFTGLTAFIGGLGLVYFSLLNTFRG